MSDELIDLIDDAGNTIGVVKRSEMRGKRLLDVLAFLPNKPREKTSQKANPHHQASHRHPHWP